MWQAITSSSSASSSNVTVAIDNSNCVICDTFMMWLYQSENCLLYFIVYFVWEAILFCRWAWQEEGHILEVKNVGARQSLELLIPLPDRLATHATVELQLFYALQELHDLLSELILLLPASVDTFWQAVYLQRTQLWTNTWKKNKAMVKHGLESKEKPQIICVYMHCRSRWVMKGLWLVFV